MASMALKSQARNCSHVCWLTQNMCRSSIYSDVLPNCIKWCYKWNMRAFARGSGLHSSGGPNNDRTRKMWPYGRAHPMRKSRRAGHQASVDWGLCFWLVWLLCFELDSHPPFWAWNSGLLECNNPMSRINKLHDKKISVNKTIII